MNITDLREQLSGDPATNTSAIQATIDQLCDDGPGGTVVIPPGRWPVRTIVLKSGLTLRLERGATLVCDTDLSQFPRHARGHNKDRQPIHLLYADDCEGITIEGDGVIDGQGEAFWDEPTGEGVHGMWWRSRGERPSPLVEIRNCRDVVLRDFTIINSPGWTVHPYLCDRVRIEGITIRNHLFGPNTDGIDVNGCRDVQISNCDLTCGDDAIIIKATDDARSCERITVTGCICASNCAAFGLGAECVSGIRDVTFAGCVARQALRIIQIEMWEPGLIENITITGITGRTMSDVVLERPIYIDIQHHGRTDGKLGKCRNVVISGFTAETRGRILLTAADGATIDNVTLRDIHLTYPEIEDASVTVPRSKSTQMSNDSPQCRAINAVLVADNVTGLAAHNIATTWLQDEAERIGYHGAWFRNVTEKTLDAPRLTASRVDVERLMEQ